jgi:phage terminase large subunit-like protein
MAELRISLNKPQQAIHNSKARFKVVVAGRRVGKTTYAALSMLIEALMSENDRGVALDATSEVVYFAVDREQAKRNIWNMLKEYARPVTVHVHENSAVLTVSNGVNNCRIRLLGMDNPDAARGLKLRYAVMDEYADMPPGAWDEIIRPALMDCKGGALFIGTPKGKNHFYELYTGALTEQLGPEWEAFTFESKDNNALDRGELESMADAYSRGSQELYDQELRGKFISKGGKLFSHEDFPISAEEPKRGSYYITVDLAGFSRESGKKNAAIRRLDETAIAVVKAYPTTDNKGKDATGWWVKEIRHGRWDVEETAVQIVHAYAECKAIALGVERGALANAVAPYLDAVQESMGVWMNTRPLSHGNTAKWDRIQWALQGRAKRGLITLNKGPWVEHFLEQAVDFPSRLTHDDLIDALAYAEQLADWVDYVPEHLPEKWAPTDPIAGY